MCLTGASDFRPHYFRLSELKQRFAHVPMMALTATADSATRVDIVNQLGLRSPYIHIGSFDRPNIRYTLEEKFKPLLSCCAICAPKVGKAASSTVLAASALMI